MNLLRPFRQMINQTADGQVYLAALLTMMVSPIDADIVIHQTGFNATDTAAGNLSIAVGKNIEQSPAEAYTRVWASRDQQLVLFGVNEGNSHRVCPRFSNKARQPFCRQFSSKMIGACGSHDRVVLVMANGDIHHVNGALMGLDGDFEPVIHPKNPVHVRSAFFTEQECASHDQLPEVIAVSQNGKWIHFNGVDWQPVTKIN